MSLSRQEAKAALERAREIVEDPAYGTPPVDVIALAQRFGVRNIAPREMVEDGYVGRNRNGELVIRYRSANCLERNRFTIAHEIAHILIAASRDIDVMEAKHRRGFDFEEIMANRIAAELLMPDVVLRELLHVKQPAWKSILEMRTLFRVSTTALIRRILDLRDFAAVFVQADYPVKESPQKFRCQLSGHGGFALSVHPRVAIVEMASCFERGESPSLSVVAKSYHLVIPCAGRLMGQFGKPCYWFVGWEKWI